MSTSTAPTSLTRTIEGATVPAPGTYSIDRIHTVIGFVARHMMVTKVRGKFDDFEGTVVVAERPEDSTVSIEVRTDSISTAEERRDAHLRSSDFLDQENFPTMTFKSTSVRPSGHNWKVTGDLTLRGVTKPLVLDVEFNGAIVDPQGGVRLGFSATGEINRQDFGVSFNAALDAGGVVVSDRVQIEIESETILEA